MILSASLSGISTANSSSNAMTTSTVSRLSRPRSFWKCAPAVTCAPRGAGLAPRSRWRRRRCGDAASRAAARLLLTSTHSGQSERRESCGASPQLLGAQPQTMHASVRIQRPCSQLRNKAGSRAPGPQAAPGNGTPFTFRLTAHSRLFDSAAPQASQASKCSNGAPAGPACAARL